MSASTQDELRLLLPLILPLSGKCSRSFVSITTIRDEHAQRHCCSHRAKKKTQQTILASHNTQKTQRSSSHQAPGAQHPTIKAHAHTLASSHSFVPRAHASGKQAFNNQNGCGERHPHFQILPQIGIAHSFIFPESPRVYISIHFNRPAPNPYAHACACNVVVLTQTPLTILSLQCLHQGSLRTQIFCKKVLPDTMLLVGIQTNVSRTLPLLQYTQGGLVPATPLHSTLREMKMTSYRAHYSTREKPVTTP